MTKLEIKKFSFFKIGIILSLVAVFWIGLVFSENEKIYQNLNLKDDETITLDIELENSGIGFYKINISDFEGDSLFVQILDSNENVLVDKKIETKMAVNYFDFQSEGIYILKLTNLSDDVLTVDIEFGNTNVTEIRYPGIILFVGLLLILISAYIKLKNYRMAQPDENIS